MVGQKTKNIGKLNYGNNHNPKQKKFIIKHCKTKKKNNTNEISVSTRVIKIFIIIVVKAKKPTKKLNHLFLYIFLFKRPHTLNF